MRDKDKDKKKPGYKLRVRRLMANPNPPQPKQKRNRNQPKPQPTPKKDLPKLQLGDKMMIKFLTGLGVKPPQAAKLVKTGLRKPDDPRRRWS